MSHDFGANQSLVEDQFRRYAASREAVTQEWRNFFERLPGDMLASLQRVAAEPAPAASVAAASSPTGSHVTVSGTSRVELAWRMSRMATAFRSRGHYYANLDPLELSPQSADELHPQAFGIGSGDLNELVETDIPGFERATVGQLTAHLQSTYCGTIGFEIMHVDRPEERAWLLDRIERPGSRPAMTAAQRRSMLEHITDAQELERFLHTQYVGAKRFSLEGLDVLIPMLHQTLDEAGDAGVQDAIIGMAHRGRLNVLVNILGKGFRELFTMFNDADSSELVGRGDVKYHLGFSSRRPTPAGREMEVSLCFNPSHLEFVNPVVVGRARARLDERGQTDGRSILPVMIHGDAAFIGQGIVVETLNLAGLEGYATGGSLHIVLNNQVGFTTSPNDARSCRYSSDVVRFMGVPVFHVNAEDLDAVRFVTALALDYRQTWGRDVCVDLIGYRRFGHNEGDEPRFTQPVMYAAIDRRPTLRDMVARQMLEQGQLTEQEDQQMLAARREHMLAALQESRDNPAEKFPRLMEPSWATYRGGMDHEVPEVPTAVALETLQALLAQVCNLPESAHVHPKVARVYQQRLECTDPAVLMDWGCAEMLAFGTLLQQGHPVRISGQDSRRGTFSHRHACLVNSQDGTFYAPLAQLAPSPTGFQVWDSPLSEAAVMGFEYGYSLDCPSGLLIWEAQFGDFGNGAQVIIDQFLAAGEDKWGRLSGLTLLLPHGFEGQGPEHSYARLGRFLQLCAEDNMQVCDVTTPAQFFHLLRRQVIRPWRKPLVVMSPKSLLRHKRCVSSLQDLAEGSFQRILGDVSGSAPGQVRRVLLCSGRIYFDLEQERERRQAQDVHIVRLEQLYPLDVHTLGRILSHYAPGTELVWVQDEPWNMGAWYFIKARLQAVFGNDLPLQCVARAESASPATGSMAAHRLENARLMDAAFGPRG
jgi:2-oxoglutarate dehydrogenase E1 component